MLSREHNFFRYTITVTPTVLTADTAIGSLPEKKRGCKLDSEHNDFSLFSKYSYAKCIYECTLRRLKPFTYCLPWDHHKVYNDYICDREYRKNFYDRMSNTQYPQCQHCLPACNTTAYSYSITKEKFKVSPNIIVWIFACD